MIYTWARRWSLLRLRGRADTGDLGGRVAASCPQPLSQGGLLHLLSDEVIPPIATLPYQTHLVAQDGQVANEANSCHGPATNIAVARGEWDKTCHQNWLALRWYVTSNLKILRRKHSLILSTNIGRVNVDLFWMRLFNWDSSVSIWLVAYRRTQFS